MSASNDSTGTPRPVPRRSHSTLHSQGASQIGDDTVGASYVGKPKERSSDTNLHHGFEDNVKMNAEICQYRKALKDRGSVATNRSPSPNSRATGGADFTTNGNDNHTTTDSWRKQLQDVMEKNTQWQVYDNQREAYVQSLHQKYHELYCRYQELNNKHHLITSNPSMIAEQQRQYYDKLLIQARQERETYQKEITQLKAEMEGMKTDIEQKLKSSKNEAKHWKTLYEKEFEKKALKECMSKDHRKEVSADKENWDRISSLQRQMEMQRKDFSSEKSKRESIERQLENLQKQLKCKESARRKSAGPRSSEVPIAEFRSKSKSMKCSSKPPTPPKLTKLSKEEKHALQNDRRSHPIQLSHVTIRKMSNTRHKVDENKLNQTYSEFGSHDDSNLSCPNCGKVYDVDEHEFLLAHIDLCL